MKITKTQLMQIIKEELKNSSNLTQTLGEGTEKSHLLSEDREFDLKNFNYLTDKINKFYNDHKEGRNAIKGEQANKLVAETIYHFLSSLKGAINDTLLDNGGNFFVALEQAAKQLPKYGYDKKDYTGEFGMAGKAGSSSGGDSGEQR